MAITMHDVGNHRRPAYLQHPQYFGKCLFATLRISDVMNRKTARNHVKILVRERQLPHVSRVQFDSVTDILYLGITQGHLLAVSRLVGSRPEVDADSMSRR
jgi:hypothetical protein